MPGCWHLPPLIQGVEMPATRRPAYTTRQSPCRWKPSTAPPRHGQSAQLLRLVGQHKKADAEATCGVPVKGKCQRHGIVRELRASGKTPWCAGCNTETSAKYLRMEFPEGAYSVLRMQEHLGPQHCDAGEVKVDEWEIDAGDGQRIAELISERFQASVSHFKRVQRRYKDECLGWHFAVGDTCEGLYVELQVLVRHSGQLTQVLRELTGCTRQKASFQADTVIRSDYLETKSAQLRSDWAGLLKCALLSLEDDVMFIPIFLALGSRQLCQSYGELRAAYSAANEEEERNGERENLKRCPVMDNVGQLCGMELEFFLDPQDQHPLNYEALGYTRPTVYAARSGP